jgi:hypothetical protein
VAFDDPSNTSSESGVFATLGTTPGLGRARFNKDILDRWNQKSRAHGSVQEAMSPSASTVNLEPAKPKENFGVFQYPIFEREIPREIKLQEWEGQVQEIGPHYFSARLSI